MKAWSDQRFFVMPDFSAPNALPDFAAAGQPAATPQTLVTVQLDADLVDWFQKNQPDGMSWQQDMNSVLRFYKDSIEAMERAHAQDLAAERPDYEPDFIPR